MIITRTPLRISFLGGGTDYPAWYREHPGAVLATTIDKYCYISCRRLPPFFKYKSRIVYSKTELINQLEEIEHPSVKGCLKFLNIHDGLEIHHDADLPARTGLGSSSAFTVGLLHALYALKGKMISKEQLCRDAIKVERHIIQENVGSQDQTLTSHGGFNHICFSGENTIEISPIILPSSRLKELHSHLMIIFTSFSRIASHIVVEQLQNISKKIKELQTMYEMVQEGINILNNQRDITDFGHLLHESWKLKKSLSSNISTPLIDEIYTVARKEGVIGGKLLGAGAGGFLLLFAKPEHHSQIKDKLAPLLHVPFEFESKGSQIIFYSPA